ncbi:TadE/TadG family type IV pilus assembly protein [Pseudomonas fluorescens]|uniref:TadE/TadG family type IV pilus assembly protein n=1 Tax=Pseudomonas fluorescens TaxID=294 RepID=UPI001BECBC37|nr:TadE/TadG family type IV pilus assembly protein [Pseudomonas fluorescens]MBT2375119.1 pilus assembly protein [Pseudomonas fluorescens]
MKTSLPSKQKGVVAIEFAVVFVIFFAVFYGMVSYSLPLLLLQSFNQAAAQGVRIGVGVDPTAQNYPTLVRDKAVAAAQANLGWIPAAFKFDPSYVTSTYNGSELTVLISYPSVNLKGVLPFMVLPGIGTVPQLPVNLKAQSSLQF